MVGMTPIAQRAGERIAAPPGGVDEIVGVDQHAARALDRRLARGREQHARRSRSKSWTPSAPSSCASWRGERGLRHADAAAAAPEAARVGDGDGVLELAKRAAGRERMIGQNYTQIHERCLGPIRGRGSMLLSRRRHQTC